MPANDVNGFHLDLELNFQRPELLSFHAYWNAKRGARQFPGRADVVPRDLLGILPWLHMYDVVDGDADFRIRLIGSALTDMLGKNEDLRSKPVSALPPSCFERIRRVLGTVLEVRAPVRTFSRRAGIPGQDFQGLEAITAPLSSNGADIDVIVAVSMLERRK